MSRPENLLPPEDFYNEDEAKKYTQNTRIIQIQSEMTERCIELLDLNKKNGPQLILDIGCGSGISGERISNEGHFWVGLDISEHMLNVAKMNDSKGDLLLSDAGQGFGFKIGSFDYAISVSAIQWLCYSDKKINNPWYRLNVFFKALFKSLKFGGKAIFQFYPENQDHLELISNTAIKNGFFGGIFVDYPNSSKAKKYYLIISTEYLGKLELKPKNYEDEENESENEIEDSNNKFKKNKISKKSKKIKKNKEKGKFVYKSKLWIFNKKEQQRKKGDLVINDSKYTGRKRKDRF